ncbi:NAD(P)-dependent oxidoreductase [Gallaecimonas mangrovi]|uniref:NAD(P)-dependent oxidoreductase n=1 Tax=Gallaecimonas mangrovi TaxID=2291597 RepID=UPI000E202128|nr:NAD(P)-dependent oxidoreductase [Gallaecimonas mangrovi]
MKAVLLDADTLGDDIDLTPIREVVSELNVYAATTPEQLEAHAGDADLLLTNKVVLDDAILAGRKGIMIMATGTNNVDMAAAKARGIPVLNVTNYGTASVAQHTLMLMLALAAKLPLYQHDLRGGAWQQSPYFCLMTHKTLQLAGKHLVIVGAGTLGTEVARLAEAFGVHVTFAARPGKSNDPRPSMESLLPKADVLSFHCPLTEQTRYLLNASALEKIKPGCLVVNCARGGVIDEDAALAALKAGKIAGLAVDVLPVEPPRQGHGLLDALAEPLNVIVTPHSAWISPEARQNVIKITAANIQSL